MSGEKSSTTQFASCQEAKGTIDDQLLYLRAQTKAFKKFSRLSQKLITKTDEGKKALKLKERVKKAYEEYLAALKEQRCIQTFIVTRPDIEEGAEQSAAAEEPEKVTEISPEAKASAAAEESGNEKVTEESGKAEVSIAAEEIDDCTKLRQMNQAAKGLELSTEKKYEKHHLQTKCFIETYIELRNAGEEFIIQLWARKLLSRFGESGNRESWSEDDRQNMAEFRRMLQAIRDGSDGEKLRTDFITPCTDPEGGMVGYVGDLERLCAWIELTDSHITTFQKSDGTPLYNSRANTFLESFNTGCKGKDSEWHELVYVKPEGERFGWYEDKWSVNLDNAVVGFKENYEKFIADEDNKYEVDNVIEFCQDIFDTYRENESIMDNLDWMSSAL